ncbi:hypothetical protein LTS18_005721, partial [Coniosporium uncinatum]
MTPQPLAPTDTFFSVSAASAKAEQAPRSSIDAIASLVEETNHLNIGSTFLTTPAEAVIL